MSYGAQSTPLAIAHRGGMALAPENSLAAFGRSVALGVDHLETDLVTTRDGALVCHHDATLRRLTGDPRRVGDVDLTDVRRLRTVGDGEPVATLAEAMHSFPSARWAVDLKDPRTVPALAGLLRANPGWATRVCVAGAWSQRLQALQALAPEVSTALGWRSLTTLIACARSRTPTPAGVADGRFAHVPLRLWGVPIFAGSIVERAHHLGIRVIVWTVNDPAAMHVLLSAGVDGIITDHPDRLRDVLVARGQWPSPSPARTLSTG